MCACVSFNLACVCTLTVFVPVTTVNYAVLCVSMCPWWKMSCEKRGGIQPNPDGDWQSLNHSTVLAPGSWQNQGWQIRRRPTLSISVSLSASDYIQTGGRARDGWKMKWIEKFKGEQRKSWKIQKIERPLGIRRDEQSVRNEWQSDWRKLKERTMRREYVQGLKEGR